MLEDYPIIVRFPLQWNEMDALHHANNVRFFAWFESARIALFEAVGLSSMGKPTVGPILATATCRFLQAVVWPADLVVGARVSHIGNTSFTLQYAVSVDETVCGEGDSVVVLIDYASGRKIPIPDANRATLASLMQT